MEIPAPDLSYTPPFGSPWDAVQIAAQAQSNAWWRSIANVVGRDLVADTEALVGDDERESFGHQPPDVRNRDVLVVVE